MIERTNKAGARWAITAGLVIAAGAWTAGPALAWQALGSEVPGCVTDSETSVKLGRFGTIGAAVAAARRVRIRPDDYAIATVAGRGGQEQTIAIDAFGVAHGISNEPCVGASGPKARDPD